MNHGPLVEALEALDVAVEQPARAALSLVVRRLVHDLNNSIGAAQLEVFNLTMLAQRPPETQDPADLVAVAENLDRVCSEAEAVLQLLRVRAGEWGST